MGKHAWAKVAVLTFLAIPASAGEAPRGYKFEWDLDVTYPDGSTKTYVPSDNAVVPLRSYAWRCQMGNFRHPQKDSEAINVTCMGPGKATFLTGASCSVAHPEHVVVFMLYESNNATNVVTITCKPWPNSDVPNTRGTPMDIH